MSDLRTAAQQALEALERYQVKRQDFDRFADEIIALRAVITEPVQEPVAWMTVRLNVPIQTTARKDVADEWLKWGEVQPLFTAPPQRKPPATIDEMFDRMDKAPKGVFFGHDPMTIWMEAWRAAEQHHGIK